MSKLLFVTHAVDYDHDRVRFICSWLEEFSTYHEEVHVITLIKGNVEGLPKNVKVYGLGKNHGTSKFHQVKEYRRLVKELTPKVDIVFVHNWPGWVILGNGQFKKHGKPILYWKCNKVRDPLVWIAGKMCTRIMTQNEWSFPYPMPEKTDYFSHGIDMQQFKQLAKEKSKTFKLMSVGRFSNEKRFPILVQAIKELEEVELTLVTAIATKKNREELGEILALVRNEGVGHKVRFAFNVPNKHMNELYNAADLTVNLCEQGALDKVVFESMAAGVPVILNNESFKPFLEEQWKDVHFKASKEDIIKKIEHFKKMGAPARKAYGKKLREIAEKKASVKQLIASYEKTIERYV